MPFKILIVGGGLSGLTLANGLLKHGKDVDMEIEIYERDAQELNREGAHTIMTLTQATKYGWEKTVLQA
jgi:2-polyprenyl-6-methoxyphenol hydroxylase-like FAD-dependent oxidoreductase